ncbi:PilZ domain-containing protein [Sphingomonas sp. BN140010]|uniref:PilZ domain-containing protein n=1 Tax=Sphingomonas arvum TaxID=2992113 RepID=A0ABT3JHB7_9SPHN|nr:PilZ domain-containing protein [Sphingomonas sp. BN140010]MCW3798462.1 PilZ domain-containing protein [Sphingomonas sp. BN140010]
MPSFGKRVDVPGGRRSSRRDHVVLAAAAMSLDKSRSVVVEDVSSTGARLLGRDLPGAGKDLLLKVAAEAFMAWVVWSTGEECGIEFEDPLDSAAVSRLKADASIEHFLVLVE